MTDPLIQEFVTSDNYRLKGRVWSPSAEPPNGTLVVLHGIQSHSGWYEYSCRKLCDDGYQICFFDRRGSGLNSNERGHASHWQRLVNDVIQLLTKKRSQQKHSNHKGPLILQAMSWGAKLAVVVAALRPDLIDGLALLYPGIKSLVKPTVFQTIQLKLAKQIGINRKQIEIPLKDAALFTGEESYQKFIKNDPLALHQVTVSFLLANRELDRIIEQAAEGIKCPVLFMLSGQDQIVDNSATRAYFERFPTRQKKMVQYPNARHTLEFEPNRDQIVADYVDWLTDLISSQKIS